MKRVDYGNATIDIQGKAEGYMRRDESIPREHLNIGDRVRAIVYEVREEQRGPQIFLSRSHPEFMAKLFTQEVPEIYDGTIEIRGVARDAGSRAKITVSSRDGSIDPVGACVGMRGSRVQAVVNELQGEKIDIVPWNDDIGVFIMNALKPAEISRVVLDEVNMNMEVIVPEEQLSLAIGRRGQNVRLASILSGWDIDILTEAEESERRAQEFQTRSALFMEALDVDDVISHLLVVEGFTSIEELIETPIDELATIEGFDEDVSAELQNRASEWLNAKQEELNTKQAELGIKDDLMGAEGLSAAQILILGEKDVKTLDDLADLAGDELVEILGEEQITEKAANDVIMAARAHWFADEGEGESESEGESAEGVDAQTDTPADETEMADTPQLDEQQEGAVA